MDGDPIPECDHVARYVSPAKYVKKVLDWSALLPRAPINSTIWASAAVSVAVHWPMPTKRATGASTVDITKGTLNEALAHPREIFRTVILNSAYGFILV